MPEAVAGEVKTLFRGIPALAVLEVGEMVTARLAQPILVEAVAVIRVDQVLRAAQGVAV